MVVAWTRELAGEIIRVKFSLYLNNETKRVYWWIDFDVSQK